MVSKEYIILEEAAVEKLLTYELAVSSIKKCLLEKANGTLNAPPKINIEGEYGSLRITAGAAEGFEKAIGFRLYDTIRDNYSRQPQLNVIYDSVSGQLKGIIVSKLLGAVRTAALNAVAIGQLARGDSETLCIIGTGYQARTHLQAILAVRSFKQILLFGRTPEKTVTFKTEMEEATGQSIEIISSIESLVKKADVLMCCTNSRKPLFNPEWVKAGTTINSIGPKWKTGSELEPSLIDRCALVCSDMIEQVKAYGEDYFIDLSGRNNMVDLSDLMVKPELGRKSDEDITLFCCVGLSGTEVVLGNDLIEKYKEGR